VMMISNGAMPPTSLSLGTLINRNRRTRPSSVHCKRQAFLYLPKVSTGFTEPCAFSAGSHLRGSSIEPPVDETKRCSLYAQAKRQTHVVCASKSDNSPDKRHKVGIPNFYLHAQGGAFIFSLTYSPFQNAFSASSAPSWTIKRRGRKQLWRSQASTFIF